MQVGRKLWPYAVQLQAQPAFEAASCSCMVQPNRRMWGVANLTACMYTTGHPLLLLVLQTCITGMLAHYESVSRCMGLILTCPMLQTAAAPAQYHSMMVPLQLLPLQMHCRPAALPSAAGAEQTPRGNPARLPVLLLPCLAAPAAVPPAVPSA